MENIEKNRLLVAEIIASELTEDEFRGFFVSNLMADYEADGDLFYDACNRNPDMVEVVRDAVKHLGLPIRDAIEGYDTNRSHLMDLIKSSKKSLLFHKKTDL